MKAIIRARVSTKGQEEGHSIAAQRQRLVDYCAKVDLIIDSPPWPAISHDR
jgi:DNA invertase Pin-like site-specific DNA recombinase